MNKKMNSMLAPRLNASSKKEANFEIGGIRALEIGQEFRRAKMWFDALSEAEQQDWLTIARSENLLDAWNAFQRKCK